MKHSGFFMTAILLSIFWGTVSPALAEDGDCQIMTSTKQVDYGRFRTEEMTQGSTEYNGKTYSGYASMTRELQVSVMCPDERKIRLFVDGPARSGKAYRFSDSGAMSVKMKDARVDGESVQLASVSRGAVQAQGGSAEITLLPDMAAAAVNGQEVAGRNWTATMMITTYLSADTFRVSNNIDLEETYTVSFDALAVN